MKKEDTPARPGAPESPALVSIVVPVYNEAGSVEEFHRRVTDVMDAQGRPYEVIFVDDGSTDATPDALTRLAAKDPHVTVVTFRRNFGQTAALAAGFDHASGDVVIAMDADLENVPEDIPAFLEKMGEGYDIVSGWRRERKHGLLLRRIPSRVANWMLSRISGVKLHDFGCTFKAYRRDMLQHVRLYGEMHRFIPAVANLSGARVAEIPVQHVQRPHGRSKYGIGRVPRVLADMYVLSFLYKYRTKPMHLFGVMALGFLALVVLLGVAGIILALTSGMSAAGALLLICTMAVLGAAEAVSLMMGYLAEMMMRTWHESTGRKIYEVREVVRGRKDPS